MLDLLSGIATVFSDPTVMLWCLIGITVGTLVGSLPGLGAVTGIALLLPMTFQLDALSGLVLLMCVYMGVMYGGRISAILINVPGAESAVVTTFDGYPLAQQGRAGYALTISAIASFVGGLLGLIGLILSVGSLAKIALIFGPADYFSIMVFALISICGFT
ncbi:MAG: tripartite tricarboxylate transporter permease, partial [Dehalobacterium sp.]